MHGKQLLQGQKSFQSFWTFISLHKNNHKRSLLPAEDEVYNLQYCVQQVEN